MAKGRPLRSTNEGRERSGIGVFARLSPFRKLATEITEDTEMKLVTDLDKALETVDHLVREDKHRITVKQGLAISWILRHLAEKDFFAKIRLKELQEERWARLEAAG